MHSSSTIEQRQQHVWVFVRAFRKADNPKNPHQIIQFEI